MNLPPCSNWLTTYDSREAWAADARNGAPHFSVGSSTVYKLLELCPTDWGDVWSVYQDARSGRTPNVDADQTQLQRGQDWEDAVVHWHAAVHLLGAPGHAPLCRCSPPGLPWFRPSPDGFAFDAETGTWGVVEAKVLHASQARLFADGSTWASLKEVETALRAHEPALPIHYMAQAMTMLAATGLQWVDVVAAFAWDWDGVSDSLPIFGLSREQALPGLVVAEAVQMKVVRVHRDAYALEGLVKRVAQLRHRHLVQGLPPEPTGSGAHWDALTQQVRGGVRPATPEEVELATELAWLRAQRSELEQAIRRTSGALGQAIAPHKSITIPRPGKDARATVTSNRQLRLSGI